MNKKFTRLTAALALLTFLIPPMVGWGQTRDNYSGTFAKCTGTLTSGTYVIGVVENSTIHAINNTVGTSWIKYTDVTISSNQIVNPNEAVVWTYDTETGYIMSVDGTNYIYWTSGNVGCCGATAYAHNVTESSTSGVYTVTSRQTTGRVLRRNGTSGYRYYTSATGSQAICFFKLDSSPSSDPSLSVSPASIAFNDKAINPSEPYEETFDVTFANLTEDLSITVGSGLTGVSVDPETISKDDTSPQTVTVSYNPTAAGNISGNITVSNGAPDNLSANVTVTGSAYDPSSVVYYNLVEEDQTDWSGVYIITYAGTTYEALTGVSNNLGSHAPVTVNNGQIQSTSTIDGYAVTITKTTGDRYSLQIGGKYLYAQNSNNLYVADVFTEDECEWTIAYSSNDLVLITNVDQSSRRIQYNTSSPRFACYAGTQQDLTLFKYASSTSTPSISASNVDIAYDATSGSITYTINNGVEGGSVAAATESDWLTIGTVGETVPFTCTANDVTTARTATVTLTYTYNTRETVTKDVTVTQAAAPVIYSSIPALFEAATGTETSVLVTFNNWVVSGVSTNGKNVFVTDNNGNGFVIFDTNGGLENTYAVGNILSGTEVNCFLKKYNGYAQINVDATALDITTGGTVTAANIAMADLAGVNTGALVHYENLTCGQSGNNYTLTDGTTTIQLYNAIYTFAAPTPGKQYNITGVYQQYNTTKEILPRSVADIEEVTSTVPSITVASATVNAPAEGKDGTLNVTYENITTVVAEVYFCDANGDDASYDWIQAEIDEDNNVYYVIGDNTGEARTAYFKVRAFDDDANVVSSNLVTVNQAKYVVDYATLPFAYDGNGQGELPNGLTVHGTGTYSNSPRIQFNDPDGQGVEDYVILHFNETPGTLSFDIKGNSFSGGTFRVQTSVDGVTYTDKASYTQISSTKETKTISDLASDVRYIKWSYTKSTGNVAFGNINLEAYVQYTLTVTATDHVEILTFVGDATTGIEGPTAQQVYNGTEVGISVSAETGYTLALTVDGTDVTSELDNTGYYSFTMPAHDVTVTATATAIPTVMYAYSRNGVESAYVEVDQNTTIQLDGADDLAQVDFTFVGWTTNANVVTNLLQAGSDFTLDDTYEFFAVYAHTTGIAATRSSMTINAETENFPSSYSGFNEYNLNGKNFMIKQVYKNDGKLQFRSASHSSGAGVIYNSESLGTISSIVLNYNSSDNNKNITIKAGTEANPTDGDEITATINESEYTFDLSSGSYSFFVMTNGDGAGYLDNIIINYSASAPVTTNYYTRVFLDETLDDDYTIAGPSIIPAGKYLDTDGNELNSTVADNFLIEEGGQLRHTGLGGVQVTMQKSITGYSNYEGTAENGGCWNLIAIPLRGFMSSALTPTHFGLITDELGSEATPETSTYDLYKFSSDGGGIGGDGKEWRNYRQPQVQNGFYIEPIMGYLYANKDNKAFSFKGAVDYRNGDVSVSDGLDWMLYGNPFPCDAYIILESGEASFYRMNDAGDDFIAVQSAIKPLEGVFVLNSGDFKFSRTAPVTTPGVNVNVNSGSQVIDRAIVSFGHGNMLPKRMLNENNTKLYIPQGTQDYAVVNAQSEGEMPVSFKASKNGTYTISVEPKNVEMTYLHLIDNKTGADVDLLATPSYSFEASTTDYASRFRLVFSANNGSNENGNETFAFFNGSEWMINNMGEATLQVVDVMGRVLSTETVNGNATINLNQMPGVYMLRLVNGDSVKVQKVVVR